MSTSTVPTKRDRRVSNFLPTDPFDRFDPATAMAGRSRKIAAVLMVAAIAGLGACAAAPAAPPLPATPTTTVAAVPVTVEQFTCRQWTADEQAEQFSELGSIGIHPFFADGAWWADPGVELGTAPDAVTPLTYCALEVAS